MDHALLWVYLVRLEIELSKLPLWALENNMTLSCITFKLLCSAHKHCNWTNIYKAFQLTPCVRSANSTKSRQLILQKPKSWAHYTRYTTLVRTYTHVSPLCAHKAVIVSTRRSAELVWALREACRVAVVSLVLACLLLVLACEYLKLWRARQTRVKDPNYTGDDRKNIKFGLYKKNVAKTILTTQATVASCQACNACSSMLLQESSKSV